LGLIVSTIGCDPTCEKIVNVRVTDASGTPVGDAKVEEVKGCCAIEHCIKRTSHNGDASFTFGDFVGTARCEIVVSADGFVTTRMSYEVDCHDEMGSASANVVLQRK
jgi:hypothetical protein